MQPHAVEVWQELRRVGRWRFILGESVRAAMATSFGMIALGLAATSFLVYRQGQTLDLQWLQIGNEAGGATFYVYRHALALLPVGFLFGCVFWLVAGASCWIVNERAHREALTKRATIAETTGAQRPAPAAAALLGAAVLAFLLFFAYLPVANNWPALRLPEPWEEVLYAAGFLGAAVVCGVTLVAWLVNMLRRAMAFVRGSTPVHEEIIQ